MCKGWYAIPCGDYLHVAYAAQDEAAFAVLRWFAGVGRDEFARRTRYFAEVFVDEVQGFCFVDFAGHYEYGVVRLVVPAVEVLKAFDGRAFDIRFFADGGLAVVVPLEYGTQHAFVEHAEGRVFAVFVLAAYDAEFAFEVFAGDEGIDHAVAFEVERPAEIFLGGVKGFEVVGAVKRGGAVGSGSALAQFLWDVGVFGRALKYEVLEQVSHTAFAIALVARAYFVGYIDGDDLFGRIWEKKHLQSIVELVRVDSFDGSEVFDSRRHFDRALGLKVPSGYP